MLRPDMLLRTPTSAVLNDLLGDAPKEQVTLEWLMGRLGDRSFGLVLLLLALLGLLPGVSAVAGVLLMVVAVQRSWRAPAQRSPGASPRAASRSAGSPGSSVGSCRPCVGWSGSSARDGPRQLRRRSASSAVWS